MKATTLYTLAAAAAVVGGYALYRRETSGGGRPQHAAGDFAAGWEHTTVDYQNEADAITDQRYERNFFERPYQIFCPGGEIRPYEIDQNGQPTGRQVVMPGESPTVGDPSEYVMVGFHPQHGYGHGFHHPHHFGHAWELEQAALAEAEAEALAAQQQDPLAMAAMGEFATGALTPSQIAMIRMRRMGMLGGGGMGRQSSFQQQLLMQQMQQMQQQIDALTAQQQLADTATLAATATTGEYATGAINPYQLAMLRHRMYGGGWRQRQLQQQLLQQQLLEAQLAQQQAELLAAQQAATALPLDPDAAGLGAAAGV